MVGQTPVEPRRAAASAAAILQQIREVVLYNARVARNNMTILRSVGHFATLHTATVLRANMAENLNCPSFKSISQKINKSNVLVIDTKPHTHTHTHDLHI